MGRRSAEVDAYIQRSAKFAQPILTKLRALYHRACPEIEETMKWTCPHFEHQAIVGSMAAFKQHVRYGFRLGGLLKNADRLFSPIGETEMRAGKATRLSDLPPDGVLLECIREAVALNEQGVKLPTARRAVRKPLPVPPWLKAALARNRAAKATFEALSPSHRREYVEWLTEAKQEATRERRLTTAIAWLAEGKSRNWKYEKKKS